jgi:effector-binding domain-containing protein
MNKLEVRIVRLEPSRVASAYGFGPSPEALAFEKMNTFLRSKDWRWGGDHPGFGFNNPNPSPGSPNYGYELWLPVSPEVSAEGEITIKDFPGGLYAVTRFEGLSRIGQVWMALVAWREDSPYRCTDGVCLEHLLNPDEPDVEKYLFDLYLPVED